MEPYDPPFYEAHEIVRGDQVAFARTIWEALAPRTVLDFGCGNAFILCELAKLSKNGIRYAHESHRPLWDQTITHLGIDYSIIGIEAARRTAKEVCPDSNVFFVHGGAYAAIAHKVPQRKYDLVISTETLEHIPPEGAAAALDAITAPAAPHIVFSAALPGDPGVNHVNCRPTEYWIQELAARGYTLSTMSSLFRKFRNCQAHWLGNAMIFVRRGQR